jgi:pyruvate formate lyase activating enzyme
MARGIIFDIKRYAIHDGPGIRTTIFFKGCSLSCQWCHNPEGIDPNPEIFLRKEKCPASCRFCVRACPNNAIKKAKNSIEIDDNKCDFCRECEEVCVYDALEIVGREVTDEYVMTEIEKDSVFYEESRGGVTFSGGEPLEQLDFLETLLEKCRERSLHTTVDTCGNFTIEALKKVCDKIDLFLYDLKVIDDEIHKKYTGQSNRLILENLRYLAENGFRVNIRIPLIAGVNENVRNISDTAEYLQSLKTVKQINLLPYHSGGSLKYERLGKLKFQVAFKPPSAGRIKKIKNIFQDKGFLVKVGG